MLSTELVSCHDPLPVLTFSFTLLCTPCQQIHSLLEFNICDTYLNRSGMCIDISYLLVVVTMAPFLCLVLTDGMVAYHAYLTITCLCASILRLNYASLPEWDECVREFHRAPARQVRCGIACRAEVLGRIGWVLCW